MNGDGCVLCFAGCSRTAYAKQKYSLQGTAQLLNIYLENWIKTVKTSFHLPRKCDMLRTIEDLSGNDLREKKFVLVWKYREYILDAIFVTIIESEAKTAAFYIWRKNDKKILFRNSDSFISCSAAF